MPRTSHVVYHLLLDWASGVVLRFIFGKRGSLSLSLPIHVSSILAGQFDYTVTLLPTTKVIFSPKKLACAHAEH